MRVKFLGHAALLITAGSKHFLFDPYLSGNPAASSEPEDIKTDYVFVSHAHGDHIGDTEQIAMANQALVISTAEVAGRLAKSGLKAHPMHVGGTHDFPFGRVRVTPAFHGSGIPGGMACGFVITTEGKTVYFAGDTGLFSDMKLLGELERIDLAFVPIGGNYTMDASDAVKAVEFLQPGVVIPIHYNTMEVIQADPVRFKAEVEEKTDSQCIILKPGEEWELK
ncbi:MAG: metal-dependent hydrolase [Halanaerobium sp.]|nr:metal-dependent hydrolase [Halanaerobium sp.]